MISIRSGGPRGRVHRTILGALPEITTVSKRLLQCLTVLFPGMAAALQAVPAQGAPAGSLQVEHADVVLPRKTGEPLEAYLVIWNSSSRYRSLVDVRSPVIAGLSVASGIGAHAALTSGPMEPLSNPPRSELLMKRSGLHMEIEATGSPLKPQGKIPLTLVFGDGESQMVTAEIRAPGEKLEDHHHAEARAD